MDKNAIKKYAVWARTELITRVSQRAEKYDITAEADVNASSVNGVLLSDAEKKQRKALIEQVKQKGFDQVMEEVAYTWFNRFIALRFMEVNGYLPSHIRVFTDDNNSFKPQILAEAIHLELDGLDMDKVYEMKNNNENDELYKYLLITQCNEFSKILPGLFQKIADYTELLFPENILREGSVIEQMITLIPEADWTDQVQIVGWLYQYYNTELKEKVFSELKKNIKISKENIPAATQLFTPDWIVRYMVENSLGRLWVEGHPDSAIKTEWKYYLEEAEQELDVQEQLDEIRKRYIFLKPEDIRVIDPCSGSGHILAYMFDVLVQIYGDYGITARDAVKSIIENNLWGLDIDERAAQLAYFSVMMKGVQYDRRFLRRSDDSGNPDIPQPHIYAIRESNYLDQFAIEQFVNGDVELKRNMSVLLDELHDAKEYGSILNVSKVDFDSLNRRFEECKAEINISKAIIEQDLHPFVQVAEALSQKYHVVVTNPPYMGSSGMSTKLVSFLQDNYPAEKMDLFSAFISRCLSFSGTYGYCGMITMESWMFLSSFEKMRNHIIDNHNIVNMIHMPYLGKGGTSLGINFGTAAVVFSGYSIKKYLATYDYIRYFETDDEGVPKAFPTKNERYNLSSVENFNLIPGSPIAYWASKRFLEIFEECPKLKDIAPARSGAKTGKNEKFIRCWWEPDYTTESFNTTSYEECLTAPYKWYPHNKGGDYCNWYGNNSLVVDFFHGGADIKAFGDQNGCAYDINAKDVFFKQGITWTALTSAKNSFRYSPEGHVFDTNKGPMLFDEGKNIGFYLLGFFISPIAQYIIDILNPSMSLQNGDMNKLPILIDQQEKEEVDMLVKQNIDIAKKYWDSKETSWDFKRLPLLNTNNTNISYACNEWQNIIQNDIEISKTNQERINAIFIQMYDLQNELKPEISFEDVSMRVSSTKDIILAFISYAVGCMFGRYSLDEEGIVFAGGEWDASRYKTFSADKDGIIPICDDEYFDDDITGLFVKFVETVYGKESLEENLQYIADALGGNGSSREIIRKYFIDSFFTDHCARYSVTNAGKSPIYWLFDSGKKNGFKCLIYIHRYQPDTIARIRTDYVHEQQSRYRTAMEETENRILAASGSDKVKLDKKLKHLKEQDAEIHAYEEKIHHLADQMIPINLDDGVKVNYAKFQDVLAKIK